MNCARTLCLGENTITNPPTIANILSNYFASVADTAKQNLKYSHKHFFVHLKHQCNNSVFIQPTDIKEMANIISSLNINKDSGPFSIPNKILVLLCRFIPSFFSSGSFPSILKLPR